LEETASRKIIKTRQGHTIQYDEMKAVNAKPIIDEIDVTLGRWFGLSEEEVDFLIGYDMKYRQGNSDEDGENEDG
jgi:hypothetical protein